MSREILNEGVVGGIVVLAFGQCYATLLGVESDTQFAIGETALCLGTLALAFVDDFRSKGETR